MYGVCVWGGEVVCAGLYVIWLVVKKGVMWSDRGVGVRAWKSNESGEGECVVAGMW